MAAKTSNTCLVQASGKTLRLGVATASVNALVNDTASNTYRYGVGGSATYEAGYQLPWRDWNESWNFIDQYKQFYTVGMVNGRSEGPTGVLTATFPTLQNIYNYEAPIITNMIANKKMTGLVWEVANEPNWYPLFAAADYATYYNMYKTLILGLDPTARMMIGGLANLVPWKTWLDNTGLTPDVWGIHPYSSPLSALSTIWSIRDFRAYRPSLPIWITEFSTGGLTAYGAPAVCSYLNQVCAWLEASHNAMNIERWFWWGVRDGTYMGENGLFSSWLCGAGTITAVGSAYYAMRG